MNENKDIRPYNHKGRPHGYWEAYYYDGTIRHKGNYINGEPHGYLEWYGTNKRFILR